MVKCRRWFALQVAVFMILIMAADSSANPRQYRSVSVGSVPHIRQKPDFCGEACVAMAMRKLGYTADQDFVFDHSGLSPVEGRGCYTKELASAVKAVGFDPGKVWYSIPAGQADTRLRELFEEIYFGLQKGRMALVCMHYDDHPKTTEHFRLITGYDAKTDEVIYQEPAEDDGNSRRMKRAMFLKLWPLKYRRDQWTVVSMLLKPTPRLKQVSTKFNPASKSFTDADFAQHVMKLRKQLPSDDFNIVLQRPFVVVGDESLPTVRKRAVQTVKWAVDRLKQDYFSKDPDKIVDVWLFKDRTSYNSNVKELWGKAPGTPYGYYSSSDEVLVMNISTGGGTLVHEIVHPFIESNFPNCPSWFNEGLASLYEQSRDNKGHIWGSTNWRLAGLQKAIKAKRVPSFKALCSTTTREFYDEDPGTNYSQARYLCHYLQEKKLLKRFFHDFKRNAAKDPTGYQTLQETLGVRDMAAFKVRWESYVAALRF